MCFIKKEREKKFRLNKDETQEDKQPSAGNYNAFPCHIEKSDWKKEKCMGPKGREKSKMILPSYNFFNKKSFTSTPHSFHLLK